MNSDSTLFCFPYAGGNSFAYRPLRELQPAGLNVVGIELPGRGARSAEALCTSLDLLAEDAFRQLSDQIASAPYALFGHSMGASLAYMTACRLRKAGFPLPAALILSGREAPSARVPKQRHLLPKEAFFAELLTLGGCPPQILADSELLAYFEPILRADFKAVETWRVQEESPLDIPFTIMIGQDDDISEADAMKWSGYTTRSLELHRFAGDHFFILRNWSEIMRLIAGRLPLAVAAF